MAVFTFMHDYSVNHSNKARSFIRLFSIVVMLVLTTAVHSATPYTENKIKAAYIYHFTQFVTWPNNEISSKKPFSICVLGEQSISHELKPLNNRQHGKRTIKLRYPKKVSDTAGCNILYIEKSEKPNLTQIFKYLSDKPILTVSSIPGFAKQGGMIDFVIHDDKIRLQSNIVVVKHAKLSISAKLLEVCLRVYNNEVDRNDKTNKSDKG